MSVYLSDEIKEKHSKLPPLSTEEKLDLFMEKMDKDKWVEYMQNDFYCQEISSKASGDEVIILTAINPFSDADILYTHVNGLDLKEIVDNSTVKIMSKRDFVNAIHDKQASWTLSELIALFTLVAIVVGSLFVYLYK